MGLKRVTGNNKKTQHLVDVEVASAIKSSNQTNPRSGGTTLVTEPMMIWNSGDLDRRKKTLKTIAPSLSSNPTSDNLPIVVSGQMSGTSMRPPSTGDTTETSTRETSEQLTLITSPDTTLSLEDFLVRASVLLGSEEGFLTLEERSLLKSAESLKLRNLRIFSLKTLKDYCLLHIQKISKNGVRKILMHLETLPEPPAKNTKLSLELRDGFFSRFSTRFGNLGMTANGRCLTANYTESHSTGRGCSLSDILETDVDRKYFLSKKAIKGLLKGQTKPQVLELYKEEDTVGGITQE